MVFNSYSFLLVFLPVTLIGFYLLRKTKYPRLSVIWLTVASLVFYGMFDPLYLALIAGSIVINYLVGLKLISMSTVSRRKWLLGTGITVNILLLGYFKYANFFMDNVNAIFNTGFHLDTIVLPLAISFFTLQQVAYLVDAYRGEVSDHGFLKYGLFVTFFPKLIAGPIMRFKEMMPQLIYDKLPRLTGENIAVGLTTIFLGLFKKVIIADSIGEYADIVFNTAASGGAISFFNSWSGALAYTFQLYFDFSGYCDIAIGLGLMFGIRIPLNFYSPYRATSIIDFWRRWHITLSRFLRDYLYIPLGGNRRGFPRQLFNLLLVMAIAGLWHGAGWTFVIWGVLHGLYLIINHAWRRLKRNFGWENRESTWAGTAISMLITFIAVTIAWVFFRADSLTAAWEVIQGMSGANGFVLTPGFYAALGPLGRLLENIGVTIADVPGFSYQPVIWILVSLVICWFLPNVQEYMSGYRLSLDSFTEKETGLRSRLKWRPSYLTAGIVAVFAVLALLGMTHVTQFIYFRF